MADQSQPERMLFTFQSNGESQGKRLVQATAEHMLIHEAPVGRMTDKRVWFGSEDELPTIFGQIGFTDLEQGGVLAGLRAHRVETREVETAAARLAELGFQIAPDQMPRAGDV